MPSILLRPAGGCLKRPFGWSGRFIAVYMYIALARQPAIIVLTRRQTDRQTDILAHTLFGLFCRGLLAILGEEFETG